MNGCKICGQKRGKETGEFCEECYELLRKIQECKAILETLQKTLKEKEKTKESKTIVSVSTDGKEGEPD